MVRLSGDVGTLTPVASSRGRLPVLDAAFCTSEEHFGGVAASLDCGTFSELKEPWGLLGVWGVLVAATFESGTSSNGQP